MTFNNLNTDGGEFTLPNGEDYVGPYHVHISLGAMVGGVHTSEPHDKLLPVNDTVEERIKSLQAHLKGHMDAEFKRQTASSSPSSPPPPPASAPSPTPSPSSSSGSSGGGGY